MTGIRELFIEGLDANFEEITESIALQGTTPVTTTSAFIRVNKAYAVRGGSVNQAVGLIDGRFSVSGDFAIVIIISETTTQHAYFSVPSDRVGYLRSISISSASTDPLIVRIISRSNIPTINSPFVLIFKLEVNNGFAQIDLNGITELQGSTDVEIDARALSGTTTTLSIALTMLVSNRIS